MFCLTDLRDGCETCLKCLTAIPPPDRAEPHPSAVAQRAARGRTQAREGPRLSTGGALFFAGKFLSEGASCQIVGAVPFSLLTD